MRIANFKGVLMNNKDEWTRCYIPRIVMADSEGKLSNKTENNTDNHSETDPVEYLRAPITRIESNQKRKRMEPEEITQREKRRKNESKQKDKPKSDIKSLFMRIQRKKHARQYSMMSSITLSKKQPTEKQKST